MKLARDTALLARRYLLQLVRNPAWVFVGLSTPLLYLALLTPLLRGLLAGPILANVATMLVFDALLVGVGVAFGFSVHLGLLVLAVLAGLLAATVSAFSMALALSSGGEIQGFAAVVNGLNLPVLLLAGVLLPLSIGPAWLVVLGHFDPLYYLVGAARALAEGNLASPDTRHAFAVPHGGSRQMMHASAMAMPVSRCAPIRWKP